MTAARPPKVAESAKQVGAANEQASREPGFPIEPDCSGDQGEAAEEPDDRAEMQEQRHEPCDRSGRPPVGEKKPVAFIETPPSTASNACSQPSHCTQAGRAPRAAAIATPIPNATVTNSRRV